MNTTTINTNGNLALKTRDRINVPFVVSTTPVPAQKEIDLTFVQFAQRKHAATTYINQVARKREIKLARKENHKDKILDIISWVGVSAVLSIAFFGIGLLGIMF